MVKPRQRVSYNGFYSSNQRRFWCGFIVNGSAMNGSFSISGFSAAVPSKVLTNHDIAQFVETSDQWIVDRTGIKSRHMLSEGEVSTDFAVIAAREALQKSGVAPSEITHVITATCTADYLCPSNACVIASQLGIGPAMLFDLNAACSGFVYGLEVSRGLFAIHPQSRILLIGVEALSRRIDWQDRGTCVIFADGAGAAVLTPNTMPGAKLIDVLCQADGTNWKSLTAGSTVTRLEKDKHPDQAFYIFMDGREIFKTAVRNMTQICRNVVEKNGLTLNDIDMFVPHQANLRIIEAVGDRLALDSSKVFVNVDTYGNTSAASIPMALAQAVGEGRIKPGMRVLLGAFGGGLTWASALIEF